MQVYKLAENIKSKGGKITREPGPVKGESLSILSNSMKRYFLSFCKAGLFQKLEILYISSL